MTVTEQKRSFLWANKKDGRVVVEKIALNYRLFRNDRGTLVAIENQNGFAVEETSECFDYFSNKLTIND